MHCSRAKSCDRIIIEKVIFIAETPKTEQKTRDFFEAFNRLSADEKVSFLAEVDRNLKKMGEKDRKIFIALIKAAKEGLSCEDAIKEVKRGIAGT